MKQYGALITEAGPASTTTTTTTLPYKSILLFSLEVVFAIWIQALLIKVSERIIDIIENSKFIAHRETRMYSSIK